MPPEDWVSLDKAKFGEDAQAAIRRPSPYVAGLAEKEVLGHLFWGDNPVKGDPSEHLQIAVGDLWSRGAG